MTTPIRVFLLEDDADLRSALESVLELEGFEVVSAADGGEAVQKAADYPFDIFVFDIKLPGPDGLEVLAQFKKENPDLLSVVMTGYATEQDTLRALRLGVGDYLKKPFRSKVLLEAVRRLEAEVKRRRALDEKERASRKMVIWLLEFWTGGLEANHDCSGMTFVECGRAAAKFALGLGHPPETAETLQGAVLMTLLKRHGAEGERVEELAALLPESILDLSRALEEEAGTDSQLTESLVQLGARCLDLTSSADRLKALEESTGVLLSSELPQKADRRRRQLLSLGRTLAASGQRAAATEAFLKLAEGTRSKDAGLAYLELARLAWSGGDRAGANKNLRAVIGLLPQLGPQAGAELELEAGLTALGMGLADGRQLLDRSLDKLARMGLSELHSLSLVALRAVSPTDEPLDQETVVAFKELAQAGAAGPLLGHSHWLFEPLLGLQLRSPHEDIRRLLLALVHNAPRSVGATLSRDLSEAELVLLFDLLEESGASALVPSLQGWLASPRPDKLRRRVESLLSGAVQQDTPTLRLHSLGPFEVFIGESRLSEGAWRTSRSRFLLAHLVGRMGRPILAEVLIEQFWPGVRPDAGKKNLSQAVSDLRKVMQDGGYVMADEAILRKHEVISFNPELPMWHDLQLFEEEFAKGKRVFEAGELRQAHQHLRRAFSLIKGDYLEDCPMDWVLPQRRENERAQTECSELLAECCQKLELHPELLEVAARVLDRDPCHQPFHLRVMESYVATGRPELALRQFERAESALRAELGVEPSTDLLRAQQIAKMSL